MFISKSRYKFLCKKLEQLENRVGQLECDVVIKKIVHHYDPPPHYQSGDCTYTESLKLNQIVQAILTEFGYETKGGYNTYTPMKLIKKGRDSGKDNQ